jgi:hypothetical protein
VPEEEKQYFFMIFLYEGLLKMQAGMTLYMKSKQ